MKTIFTLFASLLITISALAYDQSRLSISTVTNKNLRIEVDGRIYTMKDQTLMIRDLSSGHHSVKIYSERNTRKKKNGLFGNKNNQEIVYSNSIYLKDGYHLDITLNRFGKALIDERRIDRNEDWYDDDVDYNPDNKWEDRNDYNERMMNEFEFSQAKERLRREYSENSKLSLAKQIIDRSLFSSDQVKQMLQLFNFENNKLELAKYAYGRTTDKRNYYIVNEVLAFNNSKDELARYIRNF